MCQVIYTVNLIELSEPNDVEICAGFGPGCWSEDFSRILVDALTLHRALCLPIAYSCGKHLHSHAGVFLLCC